MALNENSKIGVFIVDDHQMLIDGIKALLSHSKKYDVIGEDTDAQQALLRISELKPNIVITDINMPGMNGIEFTKKLKSLLPDIKICALSMHSERAIIADIIRSGARAYVLKNTGKQELIDALDKMLEGQYYISNNISIDLLLEDTASAYSQTQTPNYTKLSERETEILKLIAQEYSNLQIANTLFISERTVETHRKNIFRKTNTKTVVGLIKFALEHQLI